MKIAGYFLTIGIFCSGCSSYKQNIMFRLPENYNINQQVQDIEANYTIQKNDYLQLDVFTNQGERIIDPGLSSIPPASVSEGTITPSYLVDNEGFVKLPLLGNFKIEGYKLKEAEELLQQEYTKYYQQPFVILKYVNKRVIVLGAPGGQVIPLVNENIKLAEVLALAKGINVEGKANNIRILRNNDVIMADLSTIEGYRKSNIIIQPNDIIYVEPVRRPVIEALRDYGPVLSVVTSLATLVVLIIGLNQ